jgi:NADPH2 dehydrogenase
LSLTIRRVAQLKEESDWVQYLKQLDVELPYDMQVDPKGSLSQSISIGSQSIGNRFCILPMEGWDGTRDGKPTDLTIRRWQRFGSSGAKWIWGGEAFAVRPDGRANPNQLMMLPENLEAIRSLRETLVNEHRTQFESIDDLWIGAQLTHSGRFARPNDKKKLEPRTLYRHPVLDRRFNITDDKSVFSDEEIRSLVKDYIKAAKVAYEAGFQFVDIKHCHGYLGHEFLSSYSREGDYGGSLANRSRFLAEITEGIRKSCPDLVIVLRLSVMDWVPFRKGAGDGQGEPDWKLESHYPYAFGGDGSGLGMDLAEPIEFIKSLPAMGINSVCVTVGSPYYNPHIQRPAIFPPSDGYLPPEDPLVGVARQIHVTRTIKQSCPEMIVVGSGYSYLQEWLPRVAQAAVARGWVDAVGLGRMVLSYPRIAADVLSGQSKLDRKSICRTFSDCTTAPRNGIVSGCYPLDSFYKSMPEYEQLKAFTAAKE